MKFAVTAPQRISAARRAFLRSVGRAATALPFYRLLESSAVSAAPGDVPQRFIGFYAPHGVSEPYYNRRVGETDTSFALGFPDSVLQPFDDAATFGKSWKDKITTIQGIDYAAGIEKSTNGHDAACVMLTGSGPVGGKPPNESIDQYLAVTKGLGASTRLGSVVLGVGSIKTESGENISYAAGGAPLPKIIDPVETFNRLFANVVVGNDPVALAALERARARGKSSIDYIRKDIARLQPRLAGPERLKLDQHLSSLRELEKRLQDFSSMGATGAQCKVPGKPNPSEFPKLRVFNGAEPYMDVIANLQIELLAQAMACDVTRFATLFITLTQDDHNMVAHTYNGPRGDKLPGDAASQLPLAKKNHDFNSKCARLMQRLDQYGILDSTLIYMSSDMGDPALHSLRNVPTILAGGANGKLKLGRRLVVEADCPSSNFYCKPPTLTANNHILVAILQAFGVAVDAYGTADDPAHVKGALAGLV